MDPVSQGVFGAVAAQTALGSRGMRRVSVAGLAGGLLPDADVVLEPFADPALPWELHRHFTHAFVMAPVMGLLAALPLLLLPAFRRIKGTVILAAIVGALTHAPLDLATSYGTKVYWPFSLENATLDLFPIIDPLFTLVLAICVVTAALKRSRTPAVLAVLFILLYTALAFTQRARALEAQEQIARARGHEPARARVMALPASLLAWRSIYEVDGHVVADTLRPGPLGETRMVVGDRLPLLSADAYAARARDPERARDVFERFAVFADHWTAWDPEERAQGYASAGDMRFSIGAAFRPPWTLRLGKTPEEPTVSWHMRNFADGDMDGLLEVILGTAPALTDLDADR